MPKNEYAHYAIPEDDQFDYPRLGHFIKGLAPEGAVELSDEEAAALEAAVTARSPKVASVAGQLPQPGPQFHVDLQPILDRLDAQARVIAEHAAVLDEHAATAAQHADKFEQQAKSIAAFKKNTAEALAQVKAGIEGPEQ